MTTVLYDRALYNYRVLDMTILSNHTVPGFDDQSRWPQVVWHCLDSAPFIEVDNFSNRTAGVERICRHFLLLPPEFRVWIAKT